MGEKSPYLLEKHTEMYMYIGEMVSVFCFKTPVGVAVGVGSVREICETILIKC